MRSVLPFRDPLAGSRTVDILSYNGEFDPGSERTLAACLRHASRGRKSGQLGEYTGARVNNTWATCPGDRDNPSKDGLIPDETTGSSLPEVKGGLCSCKLSL